MSNAIAKSSIDWDQEFEAYLKENKTLAYMMLKKAEEFADFDALTHKVKGQWVSIKWKDFGEQVRAVAKALLEMELQPGEMAGIFSANRAEWAIADLGILAIRSVSVPIYATNSAEEAAFKLARSLARKSPTALRTAKAAMNYAENNSLKAGLEYEQKVWALLFAGQDQTEGMKAFLEKRKPNYTGK